MIDADQRVRLQHPQIYQWNQALAACQDAGAVAVLGEQREDLRQCFRRKKQLLKAAGFMSRSSYRPLRRAGSRDQRPRPARSALDPG